MVWRAWALSLPICLSLIACSNRLADHTPQLAVEVVPARDSYELTQTIVVRARDEKGQILESGIEWMVEPLAAANSTNFEALASYELTREGPVTFRACRSGTMICASTTIEVEDTRPTLSVDSPLAGSEIVGTLPITIRGSASRRVGVGPVTVSVNGAPANVSPSGVFEATIPADFGIRHVEVVATDGAHPAARVEFDVLAAPEFSSAMEGARPSIRSDGGVQLWLGQDFFDNAGTPPDPNSDDLASTAATILQALDLAALLPNPVVDTETLSLSVTDASIDDVDVDLDVTAEGLELFVRIGSLRGHTAGAFVLEDQNFDLTGDLSAALSGFAELRVSKTAVDQPLSVELGDLQLTIDALDATFVDTQVDALFDLADGVLRTSIEARITEFVRESIDGVLPSLIDGLFARLDSAISDRSIALDYPLIPRTALLLDGRLARIECETGTALRAALDMRFGAETDGIQTTLGVARAAASSPSDFFDQGVAQIGVRASLLNGILHALWNAGFLDLDVSELVPDEFAGLVQSAQAEAHLPPIVRIARLGESEHDLVLSIGQLEIELEAAGIRAHFGAAIDVDMEMAIADNTISIDFPGNPRIHVWEIETSRGALLPAEAVEALLDETWPSLRRALVEVLHFELPIPPITAISAVSNVRSIEIRLSDRSPRIYQRGDLLVLDLSVRAAID